MKVFVTGGAGFIGSHFVNTLLQKKNDVIVFDNLSTGKSEFLPEKNDHLKFVQADILDYRNLAKAMQGCTTIYHFAANSNVKKGTQNTYLDLQQGIIGTHNVLEAMKENNVKNIIFSSSMTVYGEPKTKTLVENYGPCLPISLYAAAKLGAEGLLSAYASMFGINAWIFRFANVIGPRLTHGVIYDLIHKLLKNKNYLDVLGDGTQTKPYIFIDDIIAAILFTVDASFERVNLYNIGVRDTISVKDIVSIILQKMHLSQTQVHYAKTKYGWVGDIPQCDMDISKLAQLGFVPKYSSKQAVERTVEALLKEVGYAE